MACQDCHGTHGVTADEPLVDPRDKATAWTGGASAFCLRCHDGFRGSDVASSAANGPHATVECSACHEPHGAGNSSGLRGDVTSGTVEHDGLVVYDMPGGGQDLRFYCAACHQMSDAAHPGNVLPGGDITTFPVDCTTCHSHAGGQL